MSESTKKLENSNGLSVKEFIKHTKILILIAVVASIVVGSMAGLISIFQNEFFKYAFYYIAFEELITIINRHFYVFIASAIAFLLMLTGLHIWIKNKIALTIYILVLIAALYSTIHIIQLDELVNLSWSQMDFITRTSLIILFLISIDLIVGKQWLRFPSKVTSLQSIIIGLLLIPVILNVVNLVWFNKLQKNLSDKPNILILVVDALRADHVSCLGYNRETTPNIDTLASEGILFTQAVSNSNGTLITIPSIFTFVFPSVHGIANDGDILSSKFVTLAEVLRNQGYSTLAYMPNPHLKKKFNFDQGFGIYDDQILNIRTPGLSKSERFETAKRINNRVLKWLEDNNRRFLIYIHYRDVHAPYVPPSPYDELYYDSDDPKNVRRITDEEYSIMYPEMRHEDDYNDLNYYLSQYDGEIRYVDDQIKHLLDAMKKLGVLDNTFLFLTADHGEHFLEHGNWTHGQTLYDEVIHIPLIIKFPENEMQGMRLDAPVHTFDISATILDLLELKPEINMQAKSLLPLVNREVDNVWEYTFVESVDDPVKKCLRNGKWKFIQTFGISAEELYNLQEDPSESDNLILQEPELAQDLRKKLGALVKANEMLSKSHLVKREKLDEKTIEQLKSLGYIK